MLHGVVVVVREGGAEVYELAGTNASKSCREHLRRGGVRVTRHTRPSHCNQKNCLYIAGQVLLSQLQHPTHEWPKPPPLLKFAMRGRECRAMIERVATWVQTPGNITLRRTGWGPTVLKAIHKVARESVTLIPPCAVQG